MPDLADRISRGTVAALDLVPFDDRFGRLSRQVLAGGASRFAKVVRDDEPIHFVIPVGLAHEQIDYGALVIQSGQAGVLWRDTYGVDHTRVVPLGRDTHSRFSSLTLGGEPWMRFEVACEDEGLSFLLPPVSSSLLRSTVIDALRARPGHHDSNGPMPQPVPEPPRVRFPDPEPDEVVAPDDVQTLVLQALALPRESPQNRKPQPQLSPDEVSQPVPSPPAPLFDLYRGDERTVVAPTPRAAPVPAPTPPVAPAAAPVPAPVPAQPAGQAGYAQPVGPSATLRGFLIGLIITLLIGGIVLIIQVV